MLVMRISLDSNVWERAFDPGWRALPEAEDLLVIRDALSCGIAHGYICDAAFRLEAIRRINRADYIGRLRPGVEPIAKDCRVGISIGPEHRKHPGLPWQQGPKLVVARQQGVRLMSSLSWLFLPLAKSDDLDAMRTLETPADRGTREQLQIDVFYGLKHRGVGYAAIERIRREIDSLYGYEHPGWTALSRASSDKECKRIADAIGEWADAELVAAHVAYRNDVLCTNDTAEHSGVSTFDRHNRAWLASTFDVSLMTVGELAGYLRFRGA